MRTLLRHEYSPKGACLSAFASRAPEVLVAGPAGTGKSRACLEKLHLMCLLNEGMRGLIVRKTATSLTSTALVTWKQFVIREALLDGSVEYYGGSSQEPAQYRYSNGSVVIIGGMDRSTRIMSSEYDVIYVQEATELVEDDWEALTTRLRNGKVSFQQLIADCNPDKPTHWLKLRCDAGKTKMLESRHEDNPIYYDESGELNERGREYLGKLDALTGMRYLRLRKGIWATAEGLIYEDYDSSVHLIDKMPKGWETWNRYWSIDWGFTNPSVVQFWAEDPDGRLYLYLEIYQTGQLVEDIAKNVMAIVAPNKKWKEPQPQAVICDHDAEDRYTFERHTGLGTTPARKDVSSGIQAFQIRLRSAGDGKPRIFFLREAVVKRDQRLIESGKPSSTIDELPGYVWKKGVDGKPVPEEPEKRDDHGCDAARYMVAHKDLGSDTYFRGWIA